MTAAETTLKLSLDIPMETYEPMVAVLSGIGFYAFEESPAALDAYIVESDFNEASFDRTLDQYFPELYWTRTIERIEARDWNAEWEKNFESVRVGDFCEIRPPFREPVPGLKHDIVVAPKMAFGTGHHATTWLMASHIADLEMAGKRVLDMGCGTGVLGILARKCGAAEVTCIDIDEWSYRNANENIALNELDGIEVILGGVEAIPEGCYEIILANINRNVLIADRDKYIEALAEGGDLVLSGIYNFDADIVISHYTKAGLGLKSRKEKEDWELLAFTKD